MHFRSEQSKLSNNLAMDQADPGTPAEQKAEAQESAKTLDDIIASLKQKDTTKVIVRFKATGNAPILKQNFYKITASHKFQTVIQFLRKELRYQGSDPLFLYINSAFAPAPDEIVGNLFKSFNTDGQLIINYCTTAAWG